MRRISKESTTPELLADAASSHSWIRGVNCVYANTGGKRFRVSIKNTQGWKGFGSFDDLGVAAHVANVAILTEQCDVPYELNADQIKDEKELAEWRRRGSNHELEQRALRRYEAVKAEQDRERERVRVESERRVKQLEEAAEQEKKAQARAQERTRAVAARKQEIEYRLRAASIKELNQLLRTGDLPPKMHELVAAELVARRHPNA